MNLNEMAKEYALKNIFEINGDLFSNNDDTAGDAVKCCVESFIAGFNANKNILTDEDAVNIYRQFSSAIIDVKYFKKWLNEYMQNKL